MTTNSISAQDLETVSVSTLLKNEMVTISVGDVYRFDLDVCERYVRKRVNDKTRIKITKFEADLGVRYEPEIEGLHQPNDLHSLAKEIAKGSLIKIPKDINNNGRDSCCECGGLTTAISARKHFCPRCEK